MWGKRTSIWLVVAIQLMSSLLETILAKEAKNRFVMLWKTPRLS